MRIYIGACVSVCVAIHCTLNARLNPSVYSSSCGGISLGHAQQDEGRRGCLLFDREHVCVLLYGPHGKSYRNAATSVGDLANFAGDGVVHAGAPSSLNFKLHGIKHIYVQSCIYDEDTICCTTAVLTAACESW